MPKLNVAKFCREHNISRGIYYLQAAKGYCNWPKYSIGVSISFEDKLLNKRIQRAKRGAKTRNIEFNLTLSDVYDLSKYCLYCGDVSIKTQGVDSRGYPYVSGSGIDRYNNSKGYIKDNIVSCCGRCNTLKRTMHGDLYLDSFIKHRSIPDEFNMYRHCVKYKLSLNQVKEQFERGYCTI